jgi:hypothetical protein
MCPCCRYPLCKDILPHGAERDESMVASSQLGNLGSRWEVLLESQFRSLMSLSDSQVLKEAKAQGFYSSSLSSVYCDEECRSVPGNSTRRHTKRTKRSEATRLHQIVSETQHFGNKISVYRNNHYQCLFVSIYRLRRVFFGSVTTDRHSQGRTDRKYQSTATIIIKCLFVSIYRLRRVFLAPPPPIATPKAAMIEYCRLSPF